jgi:tetratricopeptide (TPR) repeat protein
LKHRYLLEIDSLDELEQLLEVNSLALLTLPIEQQVVALQGSLTSHRGQLLCQLGNTEAGIQWLEKSYDIRSKDEPFKPTESAWAAGNAGNGYATANKFDQAVEWFETARSLWLQWSQGNPETTEDWPATLKTDMSFSLINTGDLDHAQRLLKEALEAYESSELYSWADAA